MDISEFYETFFEEAEELLADMESQLLDLDVAQPDAERLNAIFRAAHSIKGGAGTFGFDALQRTTHLLENLLDHARRGEMALRRDIVDTFLEAKDMLHDQLDAYRQGGEPDPQALERIC
ncbi:Hpt domain-containing protein, partial [Acinetobacter baumannii]|uniref:Hpt domain-containing protein n=1 Tax=Acinetobacter baumannii TaxID=470 RepID=UPI0018989778|nr:Hpt domain-containing protein [Acinetobacter baumannii]